MNLLEQFFLYLPRWYECYTENQELPQFISNTHRITAFQYIKVYLKSWNKKIVENAYFFNSNLGTGSKFNMRRWEDVQQLKEIYVKHLFLSWGTQYWISTLRLVNQPEQPQFIQEIVLTVSKKFIGKHL